MLLEINFLGSLDFHENWPSGMSTSSVGCVTTWMSDCLSVLLMSLMALHLTLVDLNTHMTSKIFLLDKRNKPI